jgi:hypothetical protein
MRSLTEWLNCLIQETEQKPAEASKYPSRLCEGDEGYRAFLTQTNAEFRRWIEAILKMERFSHPRNQAEAQAIVSDPNYFNYARELVAAAGGGRARLGGHDVLDAAQEVNGELWMKLLNPNLYAPQGVTWETKNSSSAERNGIRGTIRAWARNAAGTFAARLGKRRASAATYQASQIGKTDQPLDPPARPELSEVEWNDIKVGVVNELETQLRKEIESKGPHWQSRVRNLQWAIEIVKRQMVTPWQWRSMPEIAPEVPGLQDKLRGGLADQLKRQIDQARMKVLGMTNGIRRS